MRRTFIHRPFVRTPPAEGAPSYGVPAFELGYWTMRSEEGFRRLVTFSDAVVAIAIIVSVPHGVL